MIQRLHWPLALALLTVGCESMPDPGHALTPVPVAPAAGPVAPAGDAGPVPADEDGWETETFEISSEDLLAPPPPISLNEPLATDGGTDAAAAPAAPVPDPTPAPAPTVSAATPTPNATQPVQPQVQGATPESGWPLRLISTVPQAFPPRAILGLPDGTETVVSPGSMLAEHKVVVISIGADNVQLARVSSRGDHAAIAPVTLLSQY